MVTSEKSLVSTALPQSITVLPASAPSGAPAARSMSSCPCARTALAWLAGNTNAAVAAFAEIARSIPVGADA
jgi:hypothetical protein